ncbi:3-deoxy-7-phosphoheptulonate synthase [Microbulbifer sp. MLAF003]|uniref:3-deoxy-7-phosphoheptulonate synthase n=1 Tax=Microbulbifer sp. MLAF003 TaxID=3032582 RepID=UPI0024ADDD15|nr:3-deoxy-7-phosphoheptulonate synthase [Microbulbifer sp. MLAF003]WHI52272.1 3-deoxy-7-phosphoheptulonate synthase [Microbulbifer sp. MLAF003]
MLDVLVPSQTNNLNFVSANRIVSPRKLWSAYPVSVDVADFIQRSRQSITEILHGKDPRFLVIVGPCSIHDIDAAKEYASRLKSLSDNYSENLLIVMRVYFEKPRTTVGWKGFINDPKLDSSFDVEAGLTAARKLLINLAELEIPVATEVLDPVTPQYLGDLISWAAIGARTTESQTHREMVSGLSMPVGFKNNTDGNIQVAMNAMKSASGKHSFLGIDSDGRISVINSLGNLNTHIVLRGGENPNYEKRAVEEVARTLSEARLPSNLVIDCSHANSNYDFRQQRVVVDNLIQQLKHSNSSVVGLMLESNLNEGKQAIHLPKDMMKYGVSVTDGCIGWDETIDIISQVNDVFIQRQ